MYMCFIHVVLHTIEVQAGGWYKCNGYHSQCATNGQVAIIVDLSGLVH